MRKFLAAAATALGALALVVGVAAATPNGADTPVTVGSPPTPFPQNKQNEPAVAVNPADPRTISHSRAMSVHFHSNRWTNTSPAAIWPLGR